MIKPSKFSVTDRLKVFCGCEMKTVFSVSMNFRKLHVTSIFPFLHMIIARAFIFPGLFTWLFTFVPRCLYIQNFPYETLSGRSLCSSLISLLLSIRVLIEMLQLLLNVSGRTANIMSFMFRKFDNGHICIRMEQIIVVSDFLRYVCLVLTIFAS